MDKANNLFDLLNVNVYSATPKYLQVANAIIEAVKNGVLKQNGILPSINELANHLDLSRDTAEKSYRHLRKLHIITSVPGKGYFIARTDFNSQLKVCLFFNKLSSHKKLIYDAFIKEIGSETAVDFYIYDNNSSLFRKLLESKLDQYDYYVIIPHFLDGEREAIQLINKIPKEKLILLDKQMKEIKGDYVAVYEDFENDIYEALEQTLKQLSKYNNLNIVFPSHSYFPNEILDGFIKFCRQYAFDYQILDKVETEDLTIDNAYIILVEKDLVDFIDTCLKKNFSLGKDVGLICYNETPLKRIILNGITTISTDFELLGSLAAKCILNKSKESVKVPFYLNLRPSL